MGDDNTILQHYEILMGVFYKEYVFVPYSETRVGTAVSCLCNNSSCERKGKPRAVSYRAFAGSSSVVPPSASHYRREYS